MSSDATTPNDGPVLNLINKRLRSLRKKLNRITQMEESLLQGKSLNSEQMKTFETKSSVLAAIDELDKLRVPIAQAVTQEIIERKKDEKAEKDVVLDLIKLIYFGNVFDVRSLMSGRENLMMTRVHERSCCLTYDYVTDEEKEVLREEDLDLISGVKELVVSRGVGEGLSHEKALEKCVERAKKWLEGSEETIDGDGSVTYAGLREKLNKIMASEYFTTTPEIKAPVEVAAAGASFTSSPVYGSVDASANVSVDVSIEGSVSEYKEEENKSPNSHANGSYNDESAPVEEQHQLVQGGSDVDNKSEQPANTEMDVPNTEADQNLKNADDSNDQQHSTRRSYQNRGGRGGRRNYSNGRGGRGTYRGGGYQNGRGQYNDQQNGYYPRNQNYRGRGGRGMGGNYSYREPAEHAGHAQAAS